MRNKTTRDYRAEREDNGMLVYGNLIESIPNNDGKYSSWIKPSTILGLGAFSTPTESFIGVVPETVGQATGKFDKNGTPIYENDTYSVKDRFKDDFTRETWFKIVYDGNGFYGQVIKAKNSLPYLADNRIGTYQIGGLYPFDSRIEIDKYIGSNNE